jgi:hypothetical protein
VSELFPRPRPAGPAADTVPKFESRERELGERELGFGNQVQSVPSGEILVIPDVPVPQVSAEILQKPLNLHIDIQCTAEHGNSFHLHGDISSKEQLEDIQRLYADYMPRKKWLWFL